MGRESGCRHSASKTRVNALRLHPGYKRSGARCRVICIIAATFLGALALALPCAQAAEPRPPDQQVFLDIYRELVEIDTTNSAGDTVRAAQAMAARLRDGGVSAQDIRVISSGPRKGNLVARLRGTGARRPLLLLAHLDVVEARREDWDSDPFKLVEVDGHFRGRGVIDDKAMAAIFVANLIRYVKEGFRPDRDIILALTADEELSDSPHNGVRWLLAHHRDLIDAEFAINEGGGGTLRNGGPFRFAVQHGREGLPDLSARSDGSRRPQRGAAARQPDLSPRRGVAPARAVRFSAAAQCGDAGLFRAHGGDRDAGDRRGDQGAARRPHRPRGVGATDRPPRLQRADPHHLRRHHADGRARRERVAADRPRHRELPAAAGRAGRRGRAHARDASSPTTRSRSPPRASRS